MFTGKITKHPTRKLWFIAVVDDREHDPHVRPDNKSRIKFVVINRKKVLLHITAFDRTQAGNITAIQGYKIALEWALEMEDQDTPAIYTEIDPNIRIADKPLVCIAAGGPTGNRFADFLLDKGADVTEEVMKSLSFPMPHNLAKRIPLDLTVNGRPVIEYCTLSTETLLERGATYTRETFDRVDKYTAATLAKHLLKTTPTLYELPREIYEEVAGDFTDHDSRNHLDILLDTGFNNARHAAAAYIVRSYQDPALLSKKLQRIDAETVFEEAVRYNKYMLVMMMIGKVDQPERFMELTDNATIKALLSGERFF